MIEREDVYKLLSETRLEQDVKHGSLKVHGHTPIEWLCIMRHRLALAETAFNDPKGLPPNVEDNVLNEIQEATATGVACLEEHGRDRFDRWVARRSVHPTKVLEGSVVLEEKFLREEAKSLFHALWGKATNGKEYDKTEWTRLRTLLNRIGADV